MTIRNIKRSKTLLLTASMWMLTIHYIDLYWLIMPNFHIHDVHLSLLDATTFLGIGGFFVASVGWIMNKYPLIPLKDPKLSVNTDLANALSKAFSGAMGAEVKKAQAEAQKKIDEALKPYRSKLDDTAAAKQAELGGKLKEAESRISGLGDGLLKNLTPGKMKLPKFKL